MQHSYPFFKHFPIIPRFRIFRIFRVLACSVYFVFQNIPYFPYFRIFHVFRNSAVLPFHRIGSPSLPTAKVEFILKFSQSGIPDLGAWFPESRFDARFRVPSINAIPNPFPIFLYNPESWAPKRPNWGSRKSYWGPSYYARSWNDYCIPNITAWTPLQSINRRYVDFRGNISILFHIQLPCHQRRNLSLQEDWCTSRVGQEVCFHEIALFDPPEGEDNVYKKTLL